MASVSAATQDELGDNSGGGENRQHDGEVECSPGKSNMRRILVVPGHGARGAAAIVVFGQIIQNERVRSAGKAAHATALSLIRIDRPNGLQQYVRSQHRACKQHQHYCGQEVKPEPWTRWDGTGDHDLSLPRAGNARNMSSQSGS